MQEPAGSTESKEPQERSAFTGSGVKENSTKKGNVYRVNNNESQAEQEHSPTQLSSALANYRPVVVLVVVALLAACALYFGASASGNSFMAIFMGMTLTLFAMLKLFNLKEFRDSFAEYDLATMRWPKYGYWYPTIELLLGLGLLSGVWIPAFAFFTIAIMSVTAVGVLLALINRKELECACTGSLIKVPLTSISLIESVGMALMAIALFSSSI